MEGRREEKRMTEVSEHLGGNRMKKKKITSARAGPPGPPRGSVYFTVGNTYGARSLALSPLFLPLSLFLFLAEPRSFAEKLFIGGVS